jgi:hypothetical protein
MAGISPNYRSTFDDLEFSDKEISPLWAIKDINDEKILEEWFEKAVGCCQDFYRNFFQIQMDNLLLYKGVQWLAADRQANRILDRQGFPNIRNPRVVINHLCDFVTQWVSRLTRYRPAVAIYPARAQQEDADDAKIAKSVLDYIWYTNRIDEVLQEVCRHFKIFGEAYLWIRWDPQKGDLAPSQIEANKLGMKAPVLDSSGKPVLSLKGDPLLIDKQLHIGDVDYLVDAPWHTFDQPCRSRRYIDWSIHWEVVDVDYLKAKYPDKAEDIRADLDVNNLYTGYRLDVGRLKNQIVVYELYHRSSEFMEKGRYIKRCKGCILENTDLPYEDGQIPYLYISDIEIPDQLRGTSFFQQLFPLQHQINAIASLIYKALVLYAHPKYVVQEGSVEFQQLLNESTIVSYSGGVPPTLLTQSPVAGELFSYLNKLEETAEKLSGIYTMSRGQAPSGVRAAKALRVLEEQEDKRAYITAIKYNNICLVDNAKKTLSVAGTFYDDADGRLAQIVGKDNSYKIVQFKTANLSKPWNIRVENTTALSQSPAARIDEITELMQIRFDPQGPISREQFVQLLDLTASEEFKNIVTSAIKCAQSENDDFLGGRPVADPTEVEDLINHWKIHAQPMQTREYKEMTPPERRMLLERHLLTTEYLMFEKAYGLTTPIGQQLKLGNPTFAQRLMIECPDFPLLLKQPLPLALGPMTTAAGIGGPQPQATGTIQPAPLDAGMPMDAGAPPGPPPIPSNGIVQ